MSTKQARANQAKRYRTTRKTTGYPIPVWINRLHRQHKQKHPELTPEKITELWKHQKGQCARTGLPLQTIPNSPQTATISQEQTLICTISNNYTTEQITKVITQLEKNLLRKLIKLYGKPQKTQTPPSTGKKPQETGQ